MVDSSLRFLLSLYHPFVLLSFVCSELFLVYILHWTLTVPLTVYCFTASACLLALVGVGTRIFAFARHTHASSGPSSPSASFDHAKRRLDSRRPLNSLRFTEASRQPLTYTTRNTLSRALVRLPAATLLVCVNTSRAAGHLDTRPRH
jgi:hypothetical protein